MLESFFIYKIHLNFIKPYAKKFVEELSLGSNTQAAHGDLKHTKVGHGNLEHTKAVNRILSCSSKQDPFLFPPRVRQVASAKC